MSHCFDAIVKQLAYANSPVCVTAAAGCGKTEAIARAVALAEGKQLILTHTNAGVAALRSRLRKNGVSESKYRVETIASWLLKYASAYPSMSGLTQSRPQGNDWGQVYPAANQLFDRCFIRDVLAASYAGIFVDEYQDCTKQQHAIILKMADWLPVRVLGDPLQGIFNFGNNVPVDWVSDVERHFAALPELTEPYRWAGTHPELGNQLAQIRDRLIANEPVDIAKYLAIYWRPWSDSNEISACYTIRSEMQGTIAGIHQWPNDAHQRAKKLGGIYQSMEEMDCEVLMSSARCIDKYMEQDNHLAIQSEIKNIILKGCGHFNPFSDPSFLQHELLRLQQGDLSVVSNIIDVVTRSPHTQVFRRELLTEMKRAAQEFTTGRHTSFEDAAYAARYRTRVHGRKPEPRIISRTLLIKGLEFDHAIVLNADQLQNRENFYVAITRGSKSLTILSQDPILHFQGTTGA